MILDRESFSGFTRECTLERHVYLLLAMIVADHRGRRVKGRVGDDDQEDRLREHLADRKIGKKRNRGPRRRSEAEEASERLK
jgi:hypothetical protein